MGLLRLNDPVDTTTSQQQPGRAWGRKPGLSKEAQNKSYMAANLYHEGTLSVVEIARQLSVSRTTIYTYLKHRGIELGAGPLVDQHLDTFIFP